MSDWNGNGFGGNSWSGGYNSQEAADDRVDWDLTGEVPAGGRLPAGVYDVILSEFQHYNNNKTKGLKFIYTVQDGDCKGMKYFDTIVTEGTEGGVRYGRRKAKAVAVAVKHPDPGHISRIGDLMNKPFRIAVRTKEDEQYGQQPEVYDWMPAGPNQAQAPAQGAPQVQASWGGAPGNGGGAIREGFQPPSQPPQYQNQPQYQGASPQGPPPQNQPQYQGQPPQYQGPPQGQAPQYQGQPPQSQPQYQEAPPAQQSAQAPPQGQDQPPAQEAQPRTPPPLRDNQAAASGPWPEQ
ncbi:MAG: hypothetical protein LBQ12_06140 [Deltaproteobacteria bacterium]|jgi:hypothetical protein|nr:hypothetical protein [Deltaproteobacteria bacterium]